MSTAPSSAAVPAGGLILPVLAKYWWLILLRGIVAIIFGVLAFAWPGITLITLILFYGAFALADGVLALGHAIMGGNVGSRWWLALVGIAGIAAGLVTFLMPGLTALVLLFFIAGWAIALGVFQIIGAIRLRHLLIGDHHPAGLYCVGAASDAQVEIGIRQTEIGEESIRHVGIVVLAGMHQHGFAPRRALQRVVNRRDLHEIRSRGRDQMDREQVKVCRWDTR